MQHTSRLTASDLSILLIEPSKTQLKVITHHLSSEDIRNIEGLNTGNDALHYNL
jgi:two-component system chemotaxis response regulator CheY